MKFDPKTLADAPATEDLIRETQQESTADFIRQCEKDGVDGTMSLLLSCACTLAMAMHSAASRLILEDDDAAASFRAMFNKLNEREQLMVLMTAPHALAAGIFARQVQITKEVENPFAAIAALQELERAAKVAFNTGLKLADDIADALRIAKETEDNTGSSTHRMKCGNIHIWPSKDKTAKS